MSLSWVRFEASPAETEHLQNMEPCRAGWDGCWCRGTSEARDVGGKAETVKEQVRTV